MCAAEIDFPRGGAPATAHNQPHLNRNGHRSSGGIFGQKRKFPETKVEVTKKSKRTDLLKEEDGGDGKSTFGNYSDVFRQHLTAEMMVVDVRGLGIVKKIGETNITLETAEGIQLILSGDRISRPFTQSLISGCDTSLDQLFTFGQAVAFKVTKAAKNEGLDAKKKKMKSEVSICPYEVNSHLVLSNFSTGLVVNGAVKSVEEKGVVIDLGLPNTKVTGFIQKEDLPSYLSLDTLHIGQVILLRVKITPAETSRVINLSAFPEMDTYEPEQLKLNQLMPGCVLMAHPEKIVQDGVFVKLNNETNAFIRKIHLPPRLHLDPSKFTKPLKVCVLCCQQNSPLLVLGGHPDLVALSRLEKRAIPEDFAVGKKVNCKVYELDKQMNVYFHFEADEQGKTPLLTAKALRIHIDDESNILANYTIGSSHLCRIIGHSSIERLVNVSTKSSTLSAKVISASAAKPGERVNTSIVAIKPNGLTVQLGEDLQGCVTTMHVKDKVDKNWEKGFRKDQKLPCRILFFDTSTNRLILTAKPSLVNSTDKLITELSPELVGQTSIGVVVKIIDSGGLIVSFFNRVVGLVQASDAKRIQDVVVGMPLKVRVKSVEMKRNQMILDFGLEVKAEPSGKQKAQVEHKPKARAKPFNLYNARVVGPWSYGGTSAHTSAKLLLAGDSVGRIHSSDLDLEKYSPGQVPMEEFLRTNMGKLLKVKVICVGKPNSITKAGLSKLIEEHRTERFVECTLNKGKLVEPKKKLKLINYDFDFLKGQQISAFVIDSNISSTNGKVNGEINPLVRMLISPKGLPKVQNPQADPSQTVPIFSPGELVSGRVVGINKTKRGRCLEISLRERGDEEPEKPKRTRKDSDGSKATKLVKPKPQTDADVTESVSVGSSATPLEDPGFDWTLSGFSMADMAKVGAKKPKIKDPQSELEEEANEDEESYILDLSGPPVDETEEDFDQLVSGSPNSSQLWIRYIAFFMAKSQYAKAKEIAERALRVVNHQESGELFNLWTAYLNLEVHFNSTTNAVDNPDEEPLKKVFVRACASVDSLKMHKQLLRILKKNRREEEVIELFESMLKKFRHRDLDVWYLYAEHLFETGEPQKARELLQRALQSLEKKHHIAVLCKFAQMEYKCGGLSGGDAERGKTMFEKIVHTYGKKLNVWTSFIDMVLKYEGVTEARKIFERAIEENAESPKLRALYKKWLDAEEKYGNEQSANDVREKAIKQVDELKKKL